jgi:hypothetical protein
VKQVWKCDYCSRTHTDADNISKHEHECSFNKKNKTCYTCMYQTEDGYGYEHIPGCEINLDVQNGEDNGKCKGWVWEHVQEERHNKIDDLGL